MRDLEEIVERLEHGDLPLEESLAAFERGVLLTRSCQTALKEAEQKVEILLKKAGGAQRGGFRPRRHQNRLSGTHRPLGACLPPAPGAARLSDIIALRATGTMWGV